MKGFGGYGTTFLAQWKKIEETATVEEVLQQIIDDCKKVKKTSQSLNFSLHVSILSP